MPDRLTATVDREGETRQSIIAKLITAIQRLLVGVDFYDDASVGRFAQQTATLVRAAQASAARLTDSYLSLVLRDMGVTARTAPISLALDLRGVPEAQVWQRPAETYRYLRSVGSSAEAAREQAVTRMQTMAHDDVVLAVRTAARDKLERITEAVGYRRIIHPELSKGGTCGLCIAAADRIYHVSELMPVHDNCHCTVLPVLAGGEDPGHTLNQQELADLYAAAGGSTAAEKLKRTRYQIDEHGELGPVLTVKGQHFRTQAQAAADSNA